VQSHRTGGRADWSPRPDYVLAPDDRVIVVATRAGLKVFLAGDRPITSSS
jgi:Trk K+ transport system NAD-binding subunit